MSDTLGRVRTADCHGAEPSRVGSLTAALDHRGIRERLGRSRAWPAALGPGVCSMQRVPMLERAVLRQGPRFAQVGPDEPPELAGRLRRRRYRHGETIFMQGDPGTNLCIVRAGHDKLSLSSPE